MTELLEDPYLWTGLSLLAIVALVYAYGRAVIFKWLDGEITRIRETLDHGKRLRAEAEQTLAEYRLKQQEALQEAKAIVASAHQDAERLRAEAAQALRESLTRHEQQAKDRISQAEAGALAELRAATIHLAMQASAQVLREQLTENGDEAYIDRALASLPGQLVKIAGG